ncbi:Carbohydrate binding module (family 35) [Amycolatopsis arida]|uniref:Carbohydrate binding module (Family 35) n=1 Tax=Amycolatopsis arida TaxID=587909 RepID=A0A1I5M081_9PSEU|nr:family 43 glycosylhydrolase [Amycolatopsis arida]TDX93914.1 carbohydrate-binding protein with CBM35 doain [Amycolatopsis arida]SFP02870.1 Carbohydrate binding module (family 35) [Amycolatopsis arida]
MTRRPLPPGQRTGVRGLLSILVAMLVAAGSLGVAAGPAAAAPGTTFPTLAIDRDFPDPDILRVGDRYHGYATSGPAGRVPHASAPSPTGPWTVHGDALPTKPGWAGNGGFWAPDVSRRADGTYLMYFTAPSQAAGRMCLGAAVADTPAGPFRAVGTGPLVCDAAEGGDIDPASFVDTDGRRYLLYKNDGNAIGRPTILWLQPVAADGITVTGVRRELLRNDRPEEAGVIEAPVLGRRPSHYVLFYSLGVYSGRGYQTSYAVSGSLTGPFTKAYRSLVTTDSVDGRVVGPGGADVVSGPHGDHLTFHGWLSGGGARGMYVAELGWANDYPVVRGSRVRYEAERGRLNNAEVRTGARGASQGAVVARIDHADSWVELSVFAARAGGHTVHVGYAAGYGAAQHTLTVNDGPGVVVDYPDHGWDNWRQVAVPVELRAGWNTVRFTHRTRWAELDFVEVA